MRLKATVRFCQNGLWGDEPDGVHDIVCVRVADFDRVKRRVALGDPTYRSVPASRRAGRLLRADDLLIEKSGGGEKQPVGCVVHFDHPVEAICSNFVARMPVEPGHDARFLSYVHASLYSLGLTERSIKQTTGIQNLDAEAYLDERVEIPPLAEQRSIAVVLDRKTAAIDALIAKKERQIEVLHEKRRVLITQAVTKGLDPKVPMKNSGVECLGRIPAHWDALPLKRRWTIIDCKHRTVPFVDEGVPLASIGEVQGLEVDLSEAKRTIRAEFLELIEGGRRPRVGDIIYSRNATVGEAAFVATSEEFCMGQDVCLIRSERQNQRYLVFQLRSPSVMAQLDAMMVGATFKRINISQISELLICVPPPEEQDRIAGFCADVYSRSRNVVSTLLCQIAAIREYRQALISAAVTGKIDIPAEEAA